VLDAGKHKEVHMPRPQWLRLVGFPQHVVQRGIDRQAIFFEDADIVTLILSFTWNPRT